MSRAIRFGFILMGRRQRRQSLPLPGKSGNQIKKGGPMKRFFYFGMLLFLYLPIICWSEAPDGFVLVKAGAFTMGAPADETNVQLKGSETQHIVHISNDFYISKYEVTQSEWELVMGTSVKEQSVKDDYDEGLNGVGSTCPIYYVSWYEAIEFCNNKSKREGLTPVYIINGKEISIKEGADGYRLPTESEWEYAARGGHRAENYKYIREAIIRILSRGTMIIQGMKLIRWGKNNRTNLEYMI
jgi:hypothetical protein